MPHSRPHRPGAAPATLAGVVTLVALAACATPGWRPPRPAPVVAPAAAADDADVETTLLLVGDAGSPGRHVRPEPVLVAVAREAARAPARTAVVYLGDNVYSDGMALPDDPARRATEAVVDAQLLPGVPAGVPRLFVPGNHDWNHHGGRRPASGAARVRALEAYLDGRAAAGVRTAVAPRGACPGPDVHDELGPRLRVIALDTEWWLQGDAGRRACDRGPRTPDAVAAAVREAVRGAGARHVVVVAHHPLASGGPHGGHCAGGACAARRALQAVGLRRLAWSRQDVPEPTYRRMRDAIGGALADGGADGRAVLLYASGHDHDLQLLRGDAWTDARGRPPARWLAVSGAGYWGNTTPLTCLPATRVAIREAGYLRLDVRRDGSARLRAFTVARDGTATERARVRLDAAEPPDAGAAPASTC